MPLFQNASLNPVSDVLSINELHLPDKHELPPFCPPPRFGETSFEGFFPQHPSQVLARDLIQAFAQKVRGTSSRRGRSTETHHGLYLDGGFGVGKTHLLAAAFYACDCKSKAYISFQELVYVIGKLGMAQAKKDMGHIQLICIDEFELDDPGNTLIVKSFLAEVFLRGGFVIATSNTLPEAQGQGRFDAKNFKREIQSIAERFEVLTIEGEDYRKRDHLATLFDTTTLRGLETHEHIEGAKVTATWDEFFTLLNAYHPIRYSDMIAQIGTLYLRDAVTIPDQNNALRFVHFIDKLYDSNVGLRVSGEIEPLKIFDPIYRDGAFGKKHYRCLSRLSELLEENLPQEIVEAA